MLLKYCTNDIGMVKGPLFQVIYDYKNEPRKTRSDKKPTGTNGAIDLAEFLNQKDMKTKLYDKRGFYVVEANSEHIMKFGICGLSGKAGSYNRLWQYIHMYGFKTDTDPCTGVKLGSFKYRSSGA